VARVERFFDAEYDWQARAVALFACALQDLWRVYPLALPLADAVHLGERLYLAPLAELVGEHERYGIILVDRESARFFSTYMGQIEERSEWVGQDLKRHKQGGFAAARLQRHVDKLAEQNLKLAAEAAKRFSREIRCSGLILGGSEETVTQFRELLPKDLQKLVIGALHLEMAASASAVMAKSAELIDAQERERKQRLVQDLITAAAKGGDAVIGLADTFYVAHQGRAHTLVVEKGFEAPGYLCSDCGYVGAEPIQKCPFCGGEPREIEGAVNLAMQRVIRDGGRVETIADSGPLAEAGHVAAILRY
jgi:peptide subunit release factor 1 (eRF1)